MALGYPRGIRQRAREQGWTVLCASCHRRSAQEPYAPFVDAFLRFLASRPVVQRRVDLHGCSWLARLLPELAEYAIGPSPSWNLSAEQERRLMFAAVERFLANVVGPAGTLLLLDDLQWAGCDALDLLASLLRESATSGLCANLRIVGAYRDTDVARHDLLPLLLADLTRESLAATRRLAPLCRADARNLLATSLADSARDQPELIEPALIEPALIEPVLDRADGVPFFLVAWASELCAGTCSPDVALHAIPPSVRESIRQRVVVLPEVARDVLAVAAVARGSVSLPVLLTAAGRAAARTIRQEAELLSGVEAACTAGLLCESAENGYRFRREIVRETVLDDLGGARRAILCREIDAALHAHANLASSGRCAGGRGRPVRGCRQ